MKTSTTFSNFNLQVLSAACNVGYSRAYSLLPIGLTVPRVGAIEDAARIHRTLVNPLDATDTFRLVVHVEHEMADPRDRITDLLAKLTNMTESDTIIRAARRFAEPYPGFQSYLARRLGKAQHLNRMNTSELWETAIAGEPWSGNRFFLGAQRSYGRTPEEALEIKGFTIS